MALPVPRPRKRRIMSRPDFVNLDLSSEASLDILIQEREPPLDPPLYLNAFENLTATKRCSSSQDWQAYGFLVEDCFTAIQRVYIEEVLRNPDEVYEFTATGTYPKTQHPRVRTPAQYTVSEYHPVPPASAEPLPGPGAGGYSQYDTANFRDIHRAAKVVERDCLLPTRRPGWDAVGARSSIGVFLWATDSLINDQVARRAALLHRPPNLISLNASNIADNIDSTKSNIRY
ncbi:MAG: hypothetical protein Q9175_007309 [Cornicularia normoerica]